MAGRTQDPSGAGPLALQLERVPKMLGRLRSDWAPHALCVSFKVGSSCETCGSVGVLTCMFEEHMLGSISFLAFNLLRGHWRSSDVWTVLGFVDAPCTRSLYAAKYRHGTVPA